MNFLLDLKSNSTPTLGYRKPAFNNLLQLLILLVRFQGRIIIFKITVYSMHAPYFPLQ